MDSPYYPHPNNAPPPPGLGLAARTAAPAAGAQPNEAGTAGPELGTALRVSGNSPRLVTRGESSWEEYEEDTGERYVLLTNNDRIKLVSIPLPLDRISGDAAIVDFLSCTFAFRTEQLGSFFERLFSIVGRVFSPAVDRGRGLFGYSHSYSLGTDTSALFAHGGNEGTAYLTFSGEACSAIPNWTALVFFLRDELKAKITRWDGAVDDYEGTHSVDEAVALFLAGQFTCGGRNPTINQAGNWLQPDGSGRTFYVGKRKNGKLLRVYEKGMQMGIPWNPWTRWEVELHNKDREIPWDAVLEPGKYVAGCYPRALSWISSSASRIKTTQQTVNLGYQALIHWARHAFGKHIGTMLEVEGSAERVVELLRREGLPDRLDLPPIPGVGKVLPECTP